ncbi:M20/M25/M40 family metallo-hydrolase [Bizionia argentinensis JUB59]|uniref:M20/M25/M40 family metallo-hydrolase n=1 Tax=Bizionia argentinensis JUB59 TaxID=1046627 RepID=G2EH92_9FLAO|nr:M20/M25/M40 family metallo-hydrolase [Bizionia argentinensis]EGV42237.1 M20/M25/M40 family metallo-hydrolase [Bizionia argentinensis JUB59]
MKNFKYLSLIVCIALFSNHFYGQENSAYSFNSENLLEHVKELASDAYEGRRTGTAGANMAKEYIINHLKTIEFGPLDGNYEQMFKFGKGKKTYKGVNVLGYVRGTEQPEKHIVLSAHYDHEGIKNGVIYNGADDDASGVSALFAFAEYFKKHPPKHSVILAFFDAEELGLQGSKYYVANPIVPLDAIVLNINMDMVSRNVNNELYAVGIKSHPNLEAVYKNHKIVEGLTLIAGHDGTDRKDNWTYSSDHASFAKVKIPFVYFGVEDHEDYHKPTDDYENIHPVFYKNAVESIIRFFEKIDKMTF